MKIRICAFLLLLLIGISCQPDNTAPVASFTCSPPTGNIKTLFDLDADASSDPDGLNNLLLYRWDFNSDGQWETPFGPYKIYACQFPVPGTYQVRLEVKDSYDEIASSVFTVTVDSLHLYTDPRDGQVYPITKIGSYWWMARNLNYDNNRITKFVYPAADPEGLNGGLYTWSDLMSTGDSLLSQGICPPGWHVPSDDDWRNMMSVFRWANPHLASTYQISNVKFVPDQKVTHDNYQTEGAVWKLLRETGSTGFDALPLGYRNPDGDFSDRDYYFPGKTASFWTSVKYGSLSVRVRFYMTDDHIGDVFRFADNRDFAFSVRCIKESL